MVITHRNGWESGGGFSEREFHIQLHPNAVQSFKIPTSIHRKNRPQGTIEFHRRISRPITLFREAIRENLEIESKNEAGKMRVKQP